MKKIALLILALFMLGCSSRSQVKSEIERAFELVNEGLIELESKEYQEYREKLNNSDKIEKRLLDTINSSGDEIAINASKSIIAKTYQIERKINLIVGQIEDAYTLDAEGNLNNMKDKTRIDRIMIQENRAEQLGKIILANTTELILLEKELKLSDSEYLKKLRSTLNTPKNESWAHYYFHGMPGGAVLPILNKIRSDAKMARIELLESINERRS